MRTAARTELVERVASDELRVLIAATFPLVDAARAHQLGQGVHQPGKIVLLN